MADVTQILSQIEQGDTSAAGKLLPLVYDELRRLAAAKLAHEKPGQTLQATGLLHEAYLRLVDVECVQKYQKGFIHRDLKPSNVLVAEYDDRAVPKIIDLGVAKAVQQRLTEKTMFTQMGQVVGTLEYMSPEQAKLNQLDIDTRSGIYSLGVLLYELLTGETPFDRTRLQSAAFDEMLRILRQEEPPRPSIKVSSSESLPSIAASRYVSRADLVATRILATGTTERSRQGLALRLAEPASAHGIQRAASRI